MLTYCDVIDTGADRQKLWRHNDRLFPCGCYGQWFKEFVKKHVCAKFFNILEKIYEAVKCLASDVMIDWQRAMRTARNNGL